jgi:phospholipid transport system transporter-binding protein
MSLLKLPSTLMHPQASACRSAWVVAMRAAPAGASWTVDASDLTEFDSSALAVLLACRREAMALGQSWAVTGLSPKLQALAGLYGVMPLLST